MDIDNKVNILKNKLNKVQFDGCENILMGDVLHYPILAMDDDFYNASRLKKVLRITKWLFQILVLSVRDQYEYADRRLESNSLFLFSSSYGFRKDMREPFKKMANTVCNNSIVMYNGTYSLNFSGMKYLFLYRKWSCILKKERVVESIYERIYVLMNMVIPHHDYINITNHYEKQGHSFDNLVTWCDVQSVDSFFTQKFNLLGKNTITMQHGFFCERFNGWTLKGMKSKVFFAENCFTRDILRRVGFDGKIEVCGSVHNLGKVSKVKKQNANKTIGVALSGEVLHNFNQTICDKLSKIKGIENYDLLCKMHPVSEIENYSRDSLSVFKKIYKKEISGEAFMEMMDIVLLCPSTMIYGALYRNIPFLVFADDNGYYRDYELPDDFIIKVDDLDVSRIEQIFSEEYYKKYSEIREYFTVLGDIETNYRTSFNKYGVI